MATRGKLEGRITVPTGGWSGTVGGVVWTVAAGEYFLSSPAMSGSSLLAAVAAAIDAATAATITVAASTGELGTGIVTITSSTTTTIAWTSNDLRDLLGFASATTAAGTTHTGTSHARSVWLPDCAFYAPNGGEGWRGWRESDFIATETSSGGVAAFMGQELVALDLSWPAVTRARTWTANETSPNASWERFARDCIWGLVSWGTPGGPVRFYPNAATNTAFATYTVPGFAEINPVPFQESWVKGPWRIDIPRLVLDPTYSAYGV